MNILVLLAGVADNRFPLHRLDVDTLEGVVESGHARRQLSPFDEGALELALKLRDTAGSDKEVHIDVLVLEGLADEAVLRAVAAFKPDSIRRLSPQPARLWDGAFSASQFSAAIRAEGLAPELILVGREFGDQDEGSLPIMLAAELGYPHFSLAQFAQWYEGDVRLMRESGVLREWYRFEGPLLATVTNDKRNKLRHPLMKNVMVAKRQNFETIKATQSSNIEPMQLVELEAAPHAQREVQCQMLRGSLHEKAQALAAFLRR